ncbi:hypothetical protein [Mycobacteroides abscessus]|uniref:hypothetical protein n=1 Tax=Mycobacteroides abscessus TaxID=36809 RepID=UPI0010568908|nr:hypothetical protein [Mycobacteroides abscessus]
MVSEAMPTRPWSAYTVGVSWPKESFGLWHEKGARALKDAEQAYAAEQGTRDVAERFADQAKGRFAGAQYFGYLDDAELYRAIGDGLTTVGRADNAIGDEVMEVKSHLDFLDWQAHEEIAKLDPKDPMHDALLKAIVTATAADAADYSVSAGAVIAGHAAKITAAGKLPERKHPAPPGGPPGKAIQESPKIDRPGQVKPMGNEHSDGDGQTRGGDKPSNKPEDGNQKQPSDKEQSSQSAAEKANARAADKPIEGSPTKPSLGNAAGATPFSGMPSGSPGGGSGGGSPGSGLGSGLLGGGGNPTSSLTSGLKSGSGPGGLGGASPANSGFGQGLSSAGARNPFTDNLTRNFNNMYSPGPSTPLAAPPPAPPPTAAQPPAAPLATSPAGPAPVVPQAPPSAGPGTGAQMAPLAGVPGGGAPAGGSTPGTGTTGGNMAPVGADIARHAGAGAAPPGPAGPTAGGAALAGATTAAGGVATAGMVSPTYGATAGTSAGSDVPQDPLLAAAVQLCFELQHGSRFYGILDWCVGVFRTADGAGIELVATSNDGPSYIPAGVFLPRSSRLVFSDPLVDQEFRDRWFGFSDPVATMMAYAEARRGESGELPLYALAATTLMGGGLAAAEEAGVEHLHLCRYEDSPLRGKTGDQRDDDTNVHRLGMVDSELLSWWQSGDRTLAELTVRGDELTTAAHAAVSARLGDSAIIVPDVGLAVFNKLTYAEPIDDELWNDLYSSITDAHFALGSARPSDDAPLAAELYRMRHDVARFLEVLWWWRPVVEPGESEGAIKFVEMAYCALQVLGSDGFEHG